MSTLNVCCFESRPIIDNRTFKLHYRITSIALLIVGIIVAYNEIFEGSVTCANNSLTAEELDDMALYCTHNLILQETSTASDSIFHHKKKNKVEISYYGLVSLMLFFQAFLFYVPHWLWKNWEKGRMEILTDGLRGADVPPKEERKEKQSKIVNYYIDSLHMNNAYFKWYLFCELLNLLNVIFNIYLTDKLLGGNFFAYVKFVLESKLMQGSLTDNPMLTTLPTEAKCIAYSYGSSGSIVVKEALCSLPLNKIHATVYIYFRLWLIILMVFSTITLLYKAMMFSSSEDRKKTLERRLRDGTSVDIASLVQNTGAGDIFLLHLMSYNLNSKIYPDLLEDISSKIQEIKDDREATIIGINL